MTYPAPPVTPAPPTTTGVYPYPAQPTAWPYGYAPPEPTNSLVTTGSALAVLGGLIVGIGWLLPFELYWVIIGIGWLMFGPGVGVALLGLGKSRAQ